MCVPQLLGITSNALLGGSLSKATGGSFAKGAALGGATNASFVAVDRATGGKITGNKAKAPEITSISESEKISVPTQADASVQQAADDERRRLAALGSGIKTTSRGLGGAATTTKKRLLGQ